MTSAHAHLDVPGEPMDAEVARRTALDMAALTRVLFGVTTRVHVPGELAPPAPETPEPALEPSAPEASIPVPQAIPVPPPAAKPAPATDVPASLPMPGIPLPDIPVATEPVPEPVRETPRRPAGPSLELLQEIAFLEE